MPTSGPLHPRGDDGQQLDATFELRSVPVFELVYRYKAHARSSARSVNADYHAGLELLLARLGSVGASILGIAVDSAVARELPDLERELDLPFPSASGRPLTRQLCGSTSRAHRSRWPADPGRRPAAAMTRRRSA
jgi:hypothetical protein